MQGFKQGFTQGVLISTASTKTLLQAWYPPCPLTIAVGGGGAPMPPAPLLPSPTSTATKVLLTYDPSSQHGHLSSIQANHAGQNGVRGLLSRRLLLHQTKRFLQNPGTLCLQVRRWGQDRGGGGHSARVRRGCSCFLLVCFKHRVTHEAPPRGCGRSRRTNRDGFIVR